MRILFDGYWWEHGPISNRMVQRQQILAWARLYPADTLAICVPATKDRPVDLPPNVEFLRTRAPRLQALINMFVLPVHAFRWHASTVVTHNFSALPLGRSTRLVFIHDLIFLDSPRWFTVRENLYFRWMAWSARIAQAHILASTRTEAQRIRRHTGLDVSVVGMGGNEVLKSATAMAPGHLTRYPEFLLAVGRLNARKNLENLAAGAMKADVLTPQRPLVVVGERSGKSTDAHPDFARAVDAGLVVYAGALSDGELRWCYEHARTFVMVSLDEGYGLPVVEAAAFSVPVVCSDINVFRELLGDSAEYVNPNDIDSIAAGILRALRNPRPAQTVDQPSWELSVALMRAAAVQRSPG